MTLPLFPPETPDPDAVRMSDVVDCACLSAPGNTCQYACDMECDEPDGTGLCPAGSDASDCANYP